MSSTVRLSLTVEMPAESLPVDRLLNAVSGQLEGRGAAGTPATPRPAALPLEPLTPRERQVLEQVIQGSTNKQIAKALGISHRTVGIHRARIHDKYGVRGVVQLINVVRAS